MNIVSVFANAALPEKAVFVVLAAAIVAALAIAARALAADRSALRASPFIAELRIAGPALGMLMASLDALHMAQTTLRLPQAPTTAMLAPGAIEVASLAGLGAAAGLVAVALHWTLERPRRAAP